VRQLFTISALNQETGIDRRQLRELFAEVKPAQIVGKSERYTLAQLVDAIRQTGGSDISQAKTRLTVAQADKTELEIEVLRGDLIPRGQVVAGLGRLVSAAKSRLRGIPTQIAAVAVAMTEPEIEHTLAAAIDSALVELAGGSGAAVDTAAEVDGESVGGPEPAPKPRGKRRARKVEH
jgi:phage terminase Nu1 subunit (DNA packaging protein)